MRRLAGGGDVPYLLVLTAQLLHEAGIVPVRDGVQRLAGHLDRRAGDHADDGESLGAEGSEVDGLVVRREPVRDDDRLLDAGHAQRLLDGRVLRPAQFVPLLVGRRLGHERRLGRELRRPGAEELRTAGTQRQYTDR